MPTIVESTIGATTGAYPDWASWIATIPADLVSADEQHIGRPLMEGGGTDGEWQVSNKIVIASKTTDATRNVVIYPDTGHAFYENIGSGDLKYNPANGVALYNTNDYDSPTFSVGPPFSVIKGLQLKGIQGTAALGVGDDSRVQRCILDMVASGRAADAIMTAATRMVVSNCLFVTNGTRGITVQYKQNWKIINCTFNATGTPTSCFYANYSHTNNAIKNCAVFGFTNWHSGSGSKPTVTTSRSDATSVPSGVTNGFTDTDQFEDPTTYATLNMRLKVGNDLEDVGTDVSADLNADEEVDIFGTARPQNSLWDIGCIETIVGGGGTNYDDPITVSLAAALSNTALVAAAAAATASLAASVSQAAQAEAAASAAVAATVGLTQGAEVDVEQGAAVAIVVGATVTDTNAFQEVIEISAVLSKSMAATVAAAAVLPVTLEVASAVASACAATATAAITATQVLAMQASTAQAAAIAASFTAVIETGDFNSYQEAVSAAMALAVQASALTSVATSVAAALAHGHSMTAEAAVADAVAYDAATGVSVTGSAAFAATGVVGLVLGFGATAGIVAVESSPTFVVVGPEDVMVQVGPEAGPFVLVLAD